MRTEDGIFTEYAQVLPGASINDPLPLHVETFKATKYDVSQQAFDSDGSRNANYKPDEGTVIAIDGDPAREGDDVYKYPSMAGICTKIYTNNVNGKTITIRPIHAGRNDNTMDVDVTIFAGMMLPIACRGIDTSNFAAGESIIVFA